jgi:hypothetical protein
MRNGLVYNVINTSKFKAILFIGLLNNLNESS